MKFMIITTYGTNIIESEDLSTAVDEAYDNHTGYDDVVGVIKVDEIVR